MSRLWWIAAIVAVPVAILSGLVAFVVTGNAVVRAKPEDPAAQLVFRAQRDHPVTPEMLAAAKELGKALAPAFELEGTDGRRRTLAELTDGKPAVLFFVEKECPCCKGAKVFIDRIGETYGDAVNVVGIINAEGPLASTWEKAVQPKFSVLLDPEMKTIRAYKAEAGVYTTLVAPGGRIVKAYPGYSKEMLREMGRSIERLTGVTKRTIRTDDAPKEMISGCAFPSEPDA